MDVCVTRSLYDLLYIPVGLVGRDLFERVNVLDGTLLLLFLFEQLWVHAAKHRRPLLMVLTIVMKRLYFIYIDRWLRWLRQPPANLAVLSI